MSKRDRKVAFAEKVEVAEKKQREEEGEDNRTAEDNAATRFKEKHSLDSDEEDEKDEKQEKGLDDEDMAAQEDSTITYDDGIKMTPFNLKEEMEEGYFDADGNYFVKDDPNAVEDNWLQDVDWNKVEELQEWNKQGAIQGADVEGEEKIDRLAIQKQILEILRPGETILKALKRLGGNKGQTASEKWKKPKKGSENKMEVEQSEPSADDKKLVVENLTGLADQLIAEGDYSIYDETYERLKLKIEREEKAKEPVDIFAETSSVAEASSTVEPAGSKDNGTSSSNTSGAAPPFSNEVLWEYKWDKDSSDIHGPFSSTQMSDWVDSGYFSDGVWVRKTGSQDALFYSSKRIDFSLYS